MKINNVGIVVNVFPKSIKYMEAIKNLTRHYKKMIICTKCEGNGHRVIFTNPDSIFDDPEPKEETCKYCLGTGRMIRKIVIEYEPIKLKL